MNRNERIERRKVRKRRTKAIGITLLLILVFTSLNIIFTDNARIEGQELKSLGGFAVTSYCSCALCGGGETTFTATYKERQADYTVAVDPDEIPLGSRIVIDGRTYLADDTLPYLKGKTVAVYKVWHDEVLDFKAHDAEVFIVR